MFKTWDSCFKVFEVVLLMLRFQVPTCTGEIAKQCVVARIALEAYHEAFAALVREHTECWHLYQRAEDRCRAEHFPRLVRKLAVEKGTKPTWSQDFVAAAKDDRDWESVGRRPAWGCLARGKRQFSQTETA